MAPPSNPFRGGPTKDYCEADDCCRRPPRLRRSWESKFGCCAAVSLSVLEVKRLLLLTLEMLVDSRAIRFAGALLPVAFSFVDAGIGVPVAVAAVYTFRKYQVRPCYPKMKRIMRRVVLCLVVCAILNVVTIVLIACFVNLKPNSLKDLFQASMRFYSRNASYKITIDELQLDFQCCGHSSFVDWFAFNWQGPDYEDSGDEYSGRSVPFSCCNRRTILPCAHAEMRPGDGRTVNNHGCAVILSGILFKIAVVGYAMTSLIICTQVLAIILLIRIIKRVLPELCPSECSCWESRCPLNANVINYSSDDCSSPCAKKSAGRFCGTNQKKTRKLSKSCKPPRGQQIMRKTYRSTSSKCSTQSLCSTSWSSESSTSCAELTSSPSLPGRTESARIEPSAQTHHQVTQPQRRKPGF